MHRSGVILPTGIRDTVRYSWEIDVTGCRNPQRVWKERGWKCVRHAQESTRRRATDERQSRAARLVVECEYGELIGTTRRFAHIYTSTERERERDREAIALARRHKVRDTISARIDGAERYWKRSSDPRTTTRVPRSLPLYFPICLSIDRTLVYQKAPVLPDARPVTRVPIEEVALPTTGIRRSRDAYASSLLTFDRSELEPQSVPGASDGERRVRRVWKLSERCNVSYYRYVAIHFHHTHTYTRYACVYTCVYVNEANWAAIRALYVRGRARV